MDGGPHQAHPARRDLDSLVHGQEQCLTYWYHPHPHETTQKQLTYGAGGLIIIKDPVEAKLCLPCTYGFDDIPLVLTSRRFYPNGQFSFEGDDDKYGDYLLINGTFDAPSESALQFVQVCVFCNAESNAAMTSASATTGPST